MIVSSIFSVRTAASVAHMSFEYKCLHKQLVQPRDRIVLNGFICLSHTCSLHTEKFREIYNFAFAWAREKVWHLLCTLFMNCIRTFVSFITWKTILTTYCAWFYRARNLSHWRLLLACGGCYLLKGTGLSLTTGASFYRCIPAYFSS